MIRKPTEVDFKEGTAVTVLRETKRAAVESGNGVRSGVQSVSRAYLYCVFWFGILATAIPAIFSGKVWQGLLFIGGFYGLQQLIRAGYKKSLPYLSAGKPPPPEPVDARDMIASARAISADDNLNCRSGEYKLSFPIAVRQAMKLGIPGAVLLFLSLGFAVLTFIPGIAMFFTATRILFKAFFDRELIHFDERAITISSLQKKTETRWAAVVGVSAKAYSRFNLKVLLTNGSRNAIVITHWLEGGGLGKTLVPVDLLDLDDDAKVALIAGFLRCIPAGGAEAPAPLAQRPADPPTAGDPVADFDPDAIMARYLAEREQLATDMSPDLAEQIPRPLQARPPMSFGRKAA
jgi:hypothetical protein